MVYAYFQINLHPKSDFYTYMFTYNSALLAGIWIAIMNWEFRLILKWILEIFSPLSMGHVGTDVHKQTCQIMMFFFCTFPQHLLLHHRDNRLCVWMTSSIFSSQQQEHRWIILAKMNLKLGSYMGHIYLNRIKKKTVLMHSRHPFWSSKFRQKQGSNAIVLNTT